MKHLTLKAAVTQSTDLGQFTAVISNETVDRDGDIVRADALVEALKKWNRPIPLTWHHSTKAEDVFGAIDPQSARVEDGEVVVDGEVDLESERGKQAWPLMKSGVLGFSYGYIVIASKPRTGGREDVTALDVFEITGTITPSNNETRVTATKSAKALVSTIREALESAGREKFATDENAYVYVDDFDPDAGTVVFCSYGPDAGTGYQQVKYTTGPDGSVTLDDESTEVVRTVAYRAKTAPDETSSSTAPESLKATGPVDELKKRSLQAVLEIQSDGASLRKPPPQKAAPPVEPASEADLRRAHRNVMLELLTGERT